MAAACVRALPVSPCAKFGTGRPLVKPLDRFCRAVAASAAWCWPPPGAGRRLVLAVFCM